MREFGSREGLEGIHKASTDDLVRKLEKHAAETGEETDFDPEDPASVVDAAIESGIVDGESLRNDYVARHPEIDPDNPNRPAGLDTRPVEEVSNLELYNESTDTALAEDRGLDPDSPVDVATQMEWKLAKKHFEDRQMAERIVADRGDVEDPADLSDAELGKLVTDEALKKHMGEGDSPHPSDVVAGYKKASAIARLVKDHGYEREDLDPLDPGDVIRKAQEEDARAGKMRSPASPTSPPVEDRGEPPRSRSAGEGPTARPPGNLAGGGSRSPGPGGGAGADTGPSGGEPPTGGDSPEAAPAAGTPGSPGGGGETVRIVATVQDGDQDVHRAEDGRWFDSDGNVISDPATTAALEDSYQDAERTAAEMGGHIGGTIDSLETSGRTHEQATEEQGGGGVAGGESSAEQDQTGDSGSGEEDESGDSGSGEEDSGEGDNEGDGDGDEGDSTGEADDGTGEDEEGEADGDVAGDSEEGTPAPDGDVAVDPADQARFDDSSFGAGQRQDQMDAIDARGGAAGSPDDRPDGSDDQGPGGTSAAGAEQRDPAAEIEHVVGGGYSDPLDLEAEESHGAVVETKIGGGGVVDPSDDESDPGGPHYGDGIKGNPVSGVPGVSGGADALADGQGDGLDTGDRVDFDIGAEASDEADFETFRALDPSVFNEGAESGAVDLEVDADVDLGDA